MASPTLEETETLQKFREAISDLELSDYPKSDPQLLRWLRDQDMNLKKSEEMLRNSMKWRKENDIENILSWKAPDWFYRELPYFGGFTKDNISFGIVPMGQYDIKKCIESGEREAFIKYIMQMIESFSNSNKDRINSKTNYPAAQTFILIDMSKYSYSQLTSIATTNVLLELLKTLQSNYPQFFHRCVIINAPTIFTILLGILKPTMSEKIIASFRMISKESVYTSYLQKMIPQDQLPQKYGGIMQNPF